RGDLSIAGAWGARGERLLENEPESVAHGYQSLTHAWAARSTGDIENAIDLAAHALDIGSRFGDHDLQAWALTLQGTLLIATGRTAGVPGDRAAGRRVLRARRGAVPPRRSRRSRGGAAPGALARAEPAAGAGIGAPGRGERACRGVRDRGCGGRADVGSLGRRP